MGKFTLAYWPSRGFAEPARMLLEYGDVDYENKHMASREEWGEIKPKLGMDFPNLPYIIDGDVKLTESWAIYRYIGKKLNLFPATDKEARDADMLQGVIQDTRIGFARYAYSPDLYQKLEELRKNQVAKISVMEKYLKGKKYLLGEKLSFLDFALYEAYDHHRLFFTDIFDPCPNIQQYMKRFESLERIAAYFNSDRYSKFPVNGQIASWGGQKENDRKY
uniref:glutathione S-transferase 2-like n=1 Tax=Styela clava TaxID=7725 RepID=UPI001939BB92|nr:glutathione S-transferase 2-like [Styela clava]